ncbi:16S rRNA (guanine(527)-N(7))-methyltransferase RsmG [Paracoccus xiamenensis]|uniref:16S rRNA (guanine(527)-N(7))-methyltransferase RsmG n=1 Tax=Paracoccus xiamenensis TaxID=2714901 RepID=UPI00140CEF04|nr:16S rRNA (guanine(527)-N(7))-methyltransferase RsmG [Paracoccus xiamenensis]NHF72934.1 16S rRNA (guanine(527)-N(7))-methyltransferase RsmG [Paracoccus xiamenensis]
MDVSRETDAMLARYADLIAKWNPTINLVAPGTLPDLRYRHIDDSAQLFTHAAPKSGSWLDLGSGGGLPGIVIAILGRKQSLPVTLVESDRRKSAFLTTVRRELQLDNVTIKPARIEQLEQGQFSFVSARALAPLKDLLPMIAAQLASTGEAWLLKGRTWQQEVEAARATWSFDIETYPSITDAESVAMKLRKIEPNA